MECPHCKQELSYHDYYFSGNFSAYIKGYQNSGFKKKGDIYKCQNGDCDSWAFHGTFYTKGNSDDLYEGNPC